MCSTRRGCDTYCFAIPRVHSYDDRAWAWPATYILEMSKRHALHVLAWWRSPLWHRWLLLLLVAALCTTISSWLALTLLNLTLLHRNDSFVLHATAIPIPLDQAVALAVDVTTRRAFVAGGGGLVCVLDLDTGALLRTVYVGGGPGVQIASALVHVAVDARRGHIFVATAGDGLTMLDARTGQPLKALPTALGPGEVVIDPRSAHVFVRAAGSNSTPEVEAFDARTGTPLAANPLPIDVDEEPDGLAVDSQRSHGFASDGSGAVVMFDTRTGTVLHREQGSPNPYTSLAVDERTGRVFAVGDGTRNVSVFDARTDALRPAIPVGAAPSNVAVNERTGRAFTTNQGDQTVSMIDTGTLIVRRTIPVGPGMLLAMDDRRRRVIVASDTWVSVLDARGGSVLRARLLNLAPKALAVDERTGNVLIVRAGPAAPPADAWAWLPLRRWLPGIPPPPRSRAASDQVVVLDEGRAATLKG